MASNTELLQRQRDAVTRYAKEARASVEGAIRTLAALESALLANNKAAVTAAVRDSAVDSAWRKLEKLDAPPGLAEAKQQIVSGLFIGRAAVANLSGALESSSPVDSKKHLAKTVEARSLIANGLASIQRAREGVDRQLAEEASQAKGEKAGAKPAPQPTDQ